MAFPDEAIKPIAVMALERAKQADIQWLEKVRGVCRETEREDFCL